MNDPRSAILCLGLCLALAPGMCFSGEDHSSLVVTGEVKDVRLRSGVPADVVVFDVLVTVHFKNRGSKPLFVYNEDIYPWLGGRTLATASKDALSPNYLYKSGAWPASWLEWDETRRTLDQKSPPSVLIRTIEPGAEWTFDKKVGLVFGIKGNYDNSRKPWSVIKKAKPLSLRLEFLLWPTDLEELGKQLQRRWKHQGQLELGHASSEPMSLTLPETPDGS